MQKRENHFLQLIICANISFCSVDFGISFEHKGCRFVSPLECACSIKDICPLSLLLDAGSGVPAAFLWLSAVGSRQRLVSASPGAALLRLRTSQQAPTPEVGQSCVN